MHRFQAAGCYRQPAKMTSLLASAALVLFLLGPPAGTSAAGVSSLEADPSPAPFSSLVVPGVQLLDGDEQERDQLAANRADPAAVQARMRSRTRYEHLGAAAAIQTIGLAAPELLAKPRTGMAGLPAGARVSRYLSGYAAQLQLAGGGHAIAESLIPMATRNPVGHYLPVDLALREAGQDYVAANPAAPVLISKSLAGGVKVGTDGVSITPAAPSGLPLQGSGRPEQGAVVYPDTGTDLDTVVKPAAAGVEVYAVLRSINSPQRLSFEIGVPTGASLVAGKAGSGAVSVIAAGHTLALIPASSAVDADGTPVPVTTRVVGHTLQLTVAHRSGDYQYPIVLDPIVEDHDLSTNYEISQTNWRFESNKLWGFSGSQASSPARWELGVGPIIEANQWGALLYPTQGESRIYAVAMETSASTPSAVENHLGIFGPGGWEVLSALSKTYSRTSNWACIDTVACGSSVGTAGNVAAYWLNAVASGGYTGNVTAYAATVYIAQNKGPTLTLDTSKERNSKGELNIFYGSGGWISSGKAVALFDASDPGVGVSEVTYTRGTEEWRQRGECNKSAQCPPTMISQLEATGGEYLGEGLPDGEPSVKVTAFDAMGSSSTVTAKLKVDRTPPHELALSGLPTGAEISDAARGLKLTGKATDGVTGTPSSGVASFKLSVDGHEIGSPNGQCSPGPCSATGEWAINGEQFAAGKHTFTLVATDAAGNSASSETTFTVHHAASVSLGPGELNPVTGRFNLEETDVSIPTIGQPLSVTRSYNSREPSAGSEGSLGAPWSFSFGGAQELIRNAGWGTMTLVSTDGSQTTFVHRFEGEYESPAGDKGLVLSANAAGTEYTLTDKGATTVFKHVSGDNEAVWRASFVSTAAGTSTTQYTYQVVGGVLEPREELAPVPAGVRCTPSLRAGCRELTFNYASSTTATGEGSSEWGDYTGRLTRVYFVTAEENGYGEVTQVTKTVAQYAYDSKGRLRAEWDPRISPALKTTYGYDAEGHLTAISPPGGETSAFTYGTTANDGSAGRLVKAVVAPASSPLWNGSPVKNTEAPHLSGSPVVKVRMTTSDGNWSNGPVAYGYQWEDCNSSGAECHAIAGAINANYTPAWSDVGHTLVAQVRATNGGGSVVASSAASSVVEAATQAVESNSLNAVACVPGTTDCLVSDSKGNAYYSTNVSASTAATWTSWSGPGTSPSEALSCPTTSMCLMAAGSDGGYGGNMYYATSFGGSWTQAFAPAFGVDAISCVSSSFCVEGQNAGGYFRYSTSPASTWWTLETQGSSAAMKGVSCLSSSFCAMAGSTGTVYVATSTARVESSLWTASAVDGTTALDGVACTSTSSCVAVDAAGNALRLTVGSGGEATATTQSIDGSSALTAITCTGTTCVTVDGQGNVFISGDAGKTWSGQYKLEDDLTSVSCASATLCATVDTTGHAFAFNPSEGSAAREGESRSPQPGVTVEYGVPVSGGGAPYALGASEAAKWAQSDVAGEATAIFASDEPQGWPASDYRRATVDYFDSADRLVNVAYPTGGIVTSEYNSYNDVTRNLTADNRATALKEGAKSAEVSHTLDIQSTYGLEGTELLSSLGPLHTVKLASGATAQARLHTVYSYDEGAPAGGPYKLVTKVTEGAQIAGEAEADVRTTTKSYSGQNNLGWILRKPTATRTDPSGLKLVHSTSYDPTTGKVTETRTPGAGAPGEEILTGYVYKSKFASSGSGYGQLYLPEAITQDQEGNIWVADTVNNRIQEYSSGGTYLRGFGTSGTGEGQLKGPEGIAIAGNGTVWVSDTGNNRVEVFSNTGSYITQYKPTPGLKAPAGIVYAPKSELFYVANTGDNNIVIMYTDGSVFSRFGSVGTGNGQLKSPHGLAVDSAGNVWVSDTGNNRVEEFSGGGTYMSQFGTVGSGEGQMIKPGGLAIDSEGNVLVADTNNHRIESFSSTGVYKFKFGTLGTGEGQVQEPAALTLDSSNNAYVLDTGNGRVQKWVPAATVHERTGTGGTHGMQTIYYTAEGNAEASNCGGHPEWAGLPCEKRPASQPETSGVPNLPVTTTTYNIWDEPLVSTETAGTATRKTTDVYDEAGRLVEATVSSSVGTTLPTVKVEYNAETGVPTKSSTTVEGVTRSLESVYDKRGELTSYTDADGNTSSFNYDAYGRLKTMSDGKGLQTYGYDTTTGLPTKLTDFAAGTFTASYDVEGNPVTDGYPNGMNVNHTYDSTGRERGIEYVKTSHCSSGCTWYSQADLPSIHGQALSQTSTLSSQAYTYDQAGRLTKAQDTPAGEGCTTRIYAYDEETNITSLTARPPGGEGKCASEGGTAVNHSYDGANRVTDAGIAYDAFGDITKLPAGDAGGSEVSSTYYADETLASQSQAGETIGYYLDPAGRSRQIVSTGTSNSTITYHYSGADRAPVWTEDTSGKWTRNIYGLNGGLVATQAGGEAPVLQIEDLHGSVVGTASLSETATGLLSRGDSTEYGLPRTSSPPKYSWLGAEALRTEFPSGIVAMGARSYVPQIGRFLQPDPIEGGSANEYAYTYGDPVNSSDPSGEFTVATPSWVSDFFDEEAEAATEAAIQRAAEEQAAREEAEEEAREAAEEAAAEAAEAAAEAAAEVEESSYWWGGGKKSKGKKAAKAKFTKPAKIQLRMTEPPAKPGHKNCLPGEVRVGDHCEKGPGPKHRPKPPRPGPPGSPIVPIPPIISEGIEDCVEVGLCDI